MTMSLRSSMMPTPSLQAWPWISRNSPCVTRILCIGYHIDMILSPYSVYSNLNHSFSTSKLNFHFTRLNLILIFLRLILSLLLEKGQGCAYIKPEPPSLGPALAEPVFPSCLTRTGSFDSFTGFKNHSLILILNDNFFQEPQLCKY